jgi:phosphatidylserine/phosphatidylglycerophosphate/cardiolipin synthase-like enzyme
MRFKSEKVGGYRVYAVSGVNTVSFGIDAKDANTKDLLGFAVERRDPKENQRYYMYGFKVFRSLIPNPTGKQPVSTFDHPVQSFVWDDFTAKEGRKYEYFFHPLRGSPKNIDRKAAQIPITVETEPLFSKKPHDVFFNRGVASSQAYANKFKNLPPDKIKPKAKSDEAYRWLARHLDEAIIKFIDDTPKGDTLLCCFYEFRYLPVATALKRAMTRGVKVRIIVDAKENGTKTKKAFPRTDNLKTIKDAKLPAANIIKRQGNPTKIQHNKFMVRLKGSGPKAKPIEVWTGSTNISEGGIFGQTNVGHWVRDANTAKMYKAYWDILSKDPGAAKGDRKNSTAKNKAFRTDVEKILSAPSLWKKIPSGVTPVFSPRAGAKILNMYAAMNDEAKRLSCITLAFGINKLFKDLLLDNTSISHIAFMLLEKKDAPAKPRKNAKKLSEPFVALTAKNNVYKAWGSFLDDPLYQWTREINTRKIQLNQHVSYIHSKFLLVDPLGDDPIVVTGSANFSKASTNDNDENMILIRGDMRTADIYFTEFNRLFFHYYFRSVVEDTKQTDRQDKDGLFLIEDDSWLKKYKRGSLKQKRVDLFANMSPI